MIDRSALYNVTILLIMLYLLSLRAIDSLLLSYIIYNIKHIIILFIKINIVRILN